MEIWIEGDYGRYATKAGAAESTDGQWAMQSIKN